jgi:predicted RNA-binding protein with RPS1 domain
LPKKNPNFEQMLQKFLKESAEHQKGLQKQKKKRRRKREYKQN